MFSHMIHSILLDIPVLTNLDFYEFFVNDDLTDLLRSATVTEGSRTNGRKKRVRMKKDIYRLVLASGNGVLSLRDYWSSRPVLGAPLIAGIFVTRKLSVELFEYFHLRIALYSDWLHEFIDFLELFNGAYAKWYSTGNFMHRRKDYFSTVYLFETSQTRHKAAQAV
ncbi:hypothetical protein COOONC_08118 [Cooperia oncophora]